MDSMERLWIAQAKLFEEKGDPRVKHWPLMKDPWHLVTLLVLYLIFVLWLGPRIMKRRKPKSLKLPIALYNVFQVWANYKITMGVLDAGWKTHYTFGCQPVDYSDNPDAVRMAELCWWTLFIKILELLETVFFVLRKKYEQASFLHLYHHVSTLLFAWVLVKFIPGGMPTMYVLLNCSVHVVMYTYYLLTGLSTKLRTLLNPWKKYLTIIQMVQFVLMVAHASQALSPDCPLHACLPLSFIPNVLLVCCLFRRFYTRAYNPQAARPSPGRSKRKDTK
ncbi:elongation of very long chain fatty acids protein AAEL008004-like [Ischnura elegans]|uniref:elongation of very long chain fatty acids protein AAEL008004-like n=1 Tax=Ischnura elegans TaxID=197161 RepID=UPI001ED8B000|nr:elongation of very long chain fatty acids protein AAEL008004-like [Ischnura elegans]